MTNYKSRDFADGNRPQEKLFLAERIGKKGLVKNRYVIVHEYPWLGTQHALIDYVSLDYLEGYVAGAMSGKWKSVQPYLGIPREFLQHFKNIREIEPLKSLTLRRLRKETSLLEWHPDLVKRILEK